MPNWASVSYAIEGPKKDIKDFADRIDRLEKMDKPLVDNGFGNLWLGCIVTDLGKDWEKVSCRGEITYHEHRLSDDGSPSVLHLDTECAWGELTQFTELLEETYPDCTVYVCCEEDGMCIYYTNDSEGKYFDARYKVYTYEDSEYFHTLDKVVEYLERHCGVKFPDTWEEFSDALEKYNASQEYEDAEISIYRFKITD